MEQSQSPEIAKSSNYQNLLEKAREEFPALIRRISNVVSPEETTLLVASNGPEFNPEFQYPTLFDLDADEIGRRAAVIQKGLDAATEIEHSGQILSVEEEFDRAKAQTGILNLKLLSLAQKLQNENDGFREADIQQFIEINVGLNGEVNTSLYQGAVNSLHDLIDDVSPDQPKLKKISNELRAMLPPREGEERIASLPEDVFYEYSRAYHHIFNRWLDEIMSEDKPEYNAEDIRQVFERAFNSMALDESAEVSPDVTSIKYRRNEHKLFIPSTRVMDRDKLKAKIVHEVGHIARGWNGSHISEDASKGLPEYLDAEDGLMSYGEEFITGEQHSNPTYIERYLGAGLLSGAIDGVRKDFKTTYAAMWRARLILENQNRIAQGEDISEGEIVAARKESLMNAQRLFRGGNGKIPGVGWTKDKIYYEGVAKLTDFLADFVKKYGIEHIPILFAAKFDPTNNLHNRYLGTPFKE